MEGECWAKAWGAVREAGRFTPRRLYLRWHVLGTVLLIRGPPVAVGRLEAGRDLAVALSRTLWLLRGRGLYRAECSLWGGLGGLRRSPGGSCRGPGRGDGVGASSTFCSGKSAVQRGAEWLLEPWLWAAESRFLLSPVEEEGPLLDSADVRIPGWADFPARRRVEPQRILDYYASSCSFCTPLNIHVDTYLHIHVLPSQTTSGEAQG